jgi:hypothetical protein
LKSPNIANGFEHYLTVNEQGKSRSMREKASKLTHLVQEG